MLEVDRFRVEYLYVKMKSEKKQEILLNDMAYLYIFKKVRLNLAGSERWKKEGRGR